ncbi:unnamed protein product [Ectocarpus siliculosus]|uniref:Uncharacterized protein n=1 Tax=Ectocarpus siliculosus TaxID=2880 RepID=D8LNS3_ECTSI|nr:unnamed protein product [Ectocarpus siliculosus]|eukprot:CBN78283.1 unnamed protein product [Ectocarpus siliculosus]
MRGAAARGRQEREEVRVQRLSPSWARLGDGRLWILVGKTVGVERRTVSKEFTPHFLDFESRVGFVKKVVYAGLVCATMRGYRDVILGLLLGYGIVQQILFISSTLVTTIFTHAIMRKKPEVS